MQPDDVTVVVPTYNERENLPLLAEAITSQGYRMLIVDDGSPDGTGEIADRLAENLSSIGVVHRQAKEGLGRAYASAYAELLAEPPPFICQMDADMSHDPNDLPRLLAALDAGADMAIGSRYVPGGSTPEWKRGRRLISRGGNLYARTMLGLKVKDATGGFRAFRSEALRVLEPDTCRASGYAFQVEMAWRAQRAELQIIEIPIVFRDRRYGESKMDRRIVMEAMGLVTKWGLQRWTRPK